MPLSQLAHWLLNREKYGSDYHQLETLQQEGRKKADNNWKDKRDKEYQRRKICRYCVREFPWDKNLDFLPAKQKAERELENHEHICPKKNDKSGRQKLKQEK
ncbi:18632_t:CDS:2 [Racocetra persica]|uniref:18632_t:CDS:1 n=1 Tax=Racocetra persica TaxID=160502 RepID=A0ACA9N1B7_9GLOM|nr:18632_t:CDS:2 [Racocetra persica]